VTGDMNGSINQLGDLNVANTFQGQLHIWGTVGQIGNGNVSTVTQSN
jgi:hypothetical protein